jgi:hypothetical protein
MNGCQHVSNIVNMENLDGALLGPLPGLCSLWHLDVGITGSEDASLHPSRRERSLLSLLY